MIPLTLPEIARCANPRLGNNVHRREVRDKNSKRLAFAYNHKCLMQALAFISQASIPQVEIITLP
jgi:hypothetical protein